MTNPQPTPADLALAEELFAIIPFDRSCDYRDRVKAKIAALIACHTAEQTAELWAEIERKQLERDEATREAASWKRSFDAQSSEIKRLSDERDDFDDCIERLAEIGRAVGCGHCNDPDGRSQLVVCVTQTIEAAEGESERLRAINAELPTACRLSHEIINGLDDVWHGGPTEKIESAIARAEAGREGGAK